MPSASLDLYPPIITSNLYQTSDARPGVLIVTTPTIGPNYLGSLPRITNFRLITTGFLGFWSDVKLVQPPKYKMGFCVMVFHDNRWKMQHTTLHDNFNLRDAEGNVLTETKKTIQELVEYIADESGVPIQMGTVPDFQPPARWAGIKASDAMQELLELTGCRLVYMPTENGYRFTKAADGIDPTTIATGRIIVKPGPPPRIKKLKTLSSPILYEDRMDAKAQKINRTTGALEDIDPVLLPTDPDDREKQVVLRFWKPSEVTHPAATDLDKVLLLPYRAKVHAYDPRFTFRERGRVIQDAWEPFPFHQPFMIHPGDGELKRVLMMTSNGRVFIEDHPTLVSEGSHNLSDTAKLLTAYHIKDDLDKLKRHEVEIELDPQAIDTLEMRLDWITPIDSTEPDVDSDQWQDLQETVSDAMAQRYRGDTKTIRTGRPYELQGSGHVGAVNYRFSLRRNRGHIFFEVAVNFVPKNAGTV